MDRLVIIGNGFDRAHNLPTSYYDFKEYLRIYAREFYEAICKYIPEEELWFQFEMALGELDKYQVKEENASYYLDYGDENWKDSANHDFQFMVEQDLAFASYIPYYFKKWIEQIDTNVLPLVSKRIINNTCKILNFNYTDTLERAYKVPAENILYIHGKALSSKKLVVGHHDISTFQYGAVSPFNAAEEHGIYIQDDDEDFRITETKEIIKAYFQKTYKDTFGIIQMNQNFFDSLININEIFILGHSLSSVDMDYFVEIRKRVLHSCKWYISYFSESDLDNMEYFAKRLDIKNFQPVMLSNL